MQTCGHWDGILVIYIYIYIQFVKKIFAHEKYENILSRILKNINNSIFVLSKNVCTFDKILRFM